jgi:uncharacterized membrane protein HdeD (DUF308 family)
MGAQTIFEAAARAVDVLVRNWWVVALRGFAALIFGVLAFARPAAGIAALIILFGCYALINGILTVFAVIANRHGEQQWVSMLFGGLLSIAVGLLTFMMPGVTAIVLLYIIGAWAIITGLAEIATAIRLRRVITGEWMLLIAGVLSVLFGLVLFVRPGVGALAVLAWIGVYAILVGILLLAVAFRLRSWGHRGIATGTPRTV